MIKERKRGRSFNHAEKGGSGCGTDPSVGRRKVGSSSQAAAGWACRGVGERRRRAAVEKARTTETYRAAGSHSSTQSSKASARTPHLRKDCATTRIEAGKAAERQTPRLLPRRSVATFVHLMRGCALLPPPSAIEPNQRTAGINCASARNMAPQACIETAPFSGTPRLCSRRACCAEAESGLPDIRGVAR